MASVRKKHNHFQAKVRIPLPLRSSYGGKEFLYRTLPTSDSKAAAAQAAAWEAGLRLEWAGLSREALTPPAGHSPGQMRSLYRDLRERAEAGEFAVYIAGAEPAVAGISMEVDKIADRYEGKDELPEPVEYRLAALQDASRAVQGLPVPHRKIMEPAFSELAASYMVTWRAKQGLKPASTGQMMEASFHLFARYFGDKPIRGVKEGEPGAAFILGR